MKLNVYYGKIKRTYKGDDASELIREARRNKLYEEHDTITFDLEVDEDGDKCSKCQET